MNIKIIEVLWCVAGAIIFIMSDPSVEAGTVRNTRESYQDDGQYPFIDGLRINPQRPRIIDTSDLEERVTDEYPFIDGFPKIPHRFGVNLPDIDTEAPEPFSFKNGLRRNANTPKYISVIETHKNKKEHFEKTDEEYPFVNGLRRYRRSSGKFVDDAMVGSDGQYPFVDGLRKKKDDRRQPQRIFDDTDEAQVGSDGVYPFVDGVRRRISNSDQNQGQVKTFEKTNEEYPFINGLRRYRRSSGKFVDDATVGSDGQYPFVDGLRKKKDDRRQPQRIFDDTDEAQVGSDGAYPFVDGVRISNSDKNQGEVKTFETTKEEYPFINGLVDFTTTQASIYDHAIRKRSVDVENNTSTVQPSSTTEAHRFSVSKRGKYKPHRLPPPLMRIDFGKQSPTDTQLEIEVYYKPFRFGPDVRNLTVDVEWPTPNRKNDCPITYVSVRNCQINADLEDDQAAILEGGIGHTFVKLRITSFNFYLYQYAIFIFGDCRK